MRFGIRAKLFALSAALVAATLGFAEAYLRTALADLLTNGIRDDLLVRAALARRDVEALARAVPPADPASWDALADGLGAAGRARVTIVAADGRVLGDSDVAFPSLAAVENHGARPEVVAAFATGTGADTRFSDTVKAQMLYTAMVVRPGGPAAAAFGVVRVAKPLTEVDAAIARVRRTLLVGGALALLLALAMSAGAAHLASRSVRSLTKVAERMAKGDLAARANDATGPDEIAALGRALDQMARGLSVSIASLAAERDLQQRILAGMQEGVLVVDAQRRVALVNAALRETLLLPGDAVGRPLLEVVRHAGLKEIIDHTHARGDAVANEVEVSGLRPRRLLVRAVPLPGEPGGTLAVLIDVTELRRLESLRRDFVANVSHELRTPIAAVRSAAETLQGPAARDPEAAARFVDIVERNAVRLQRLVEDLLDLSRIEARQLRLVPEPIALAPFVSQVLATFVEPAAAHGVTLASDVGAATPPLVADRSALEQVIDNLVDNAVKYAGSGARVTVRARGVDGDRSIRFEVADTGPGIEERHLPRLFERFYRVDVGRSRAEGGTGLGLAIVKHLAEAMGGSVGVESKPGSGTTFAVTLPAAAATQHPSLGSNATA